MKITIKGYCKKGNKTRKGSPLYIYMNIDGEKNWYPLNKHIDPKCFDNKTGRILSSHPNSFKLNSHLTSKIDEINRIILDLESKKRRVNYEIIIEILESDNPDSFISYLREQLRVEKSTLAEKTYNGYKLGVDLFEKYRPGIKFSELNYSVIKGFENWLIRSTKNKSVNSRYQAHCPIRKYSKYAFKEKLIPEYPYEDFSLKSENSKNKEFLNLEERDKLYEYFIQNPDMDHSIRREVGNYLFSTFTGIARDDLLKPENHIIFEKDHVSYYRGKTNIFIRVKLISKAKSLVDFVKANKVFIHNTHGKNMLNKGLKLAGIDKEITYHTARNTFAITSLIKGINARAVQKVLGHQSFSTTEIYQRIANDFVDDEMDKLED